MHKRSITTLAGMQFAALKYSLSMPHNPYSPLTCWIMQRMKETSSHDIHSFLHEWHSLTPQQRCQYDQQSAKISMEYYQSLSFSPLTDRERIAKEIVLLHSDPHFHHLSNEQKAFLDSLPTGNTNEPVEKYFTRVSRFINGLNIKEIDHDQ